MDDKKPDVELVSEPRIDNRFGVKMDRKPQSSRAIKIGLFATIATLGGVLVMRTPDKPSQEHSEVKAPEASQVSGSIQDGKYDSYSAATESQKLNNQKQNNSKLVKLPGLQKIDRKHTSEIPPGSMVKAVLLTGASNGAVRAEIKEPLLIQGETLVPAGATVLGTGQSTDNRLMIRFTQIVFSDGTFDGIQAQAADAEDKTVGLHGSRLGSYAVKYGAAIGLNFVGGMSEALQDHDVVNQQVVNRPDVKNALLNGTSKATLDLAQDTMNDIKSKPPVIEVPAGKEILLIFESSH